MRKKIIAAIYTILVFSFWLVTPFLISWYKSIVPQNVQLIMPFIAGFVSVCLEFVIGIILWLQAFEK